jgi:hypothetical protein
VILNRWEWIIVWCFMAVMAAFTSWYLWRYLPAQEAKCAARGLTSVEIGKGRFCVDTATGQLFNVTP